MNTNIKNKNMIPKPLMPLNELPRWAYTETEWETIQNQSMCIVDGVRMEYDYEEWERMKYKAQNSSMDRLGLI